MPHSDIAIIGAGPYGLSIAAHLRANDIEHRIIGDPMQFWLGHMPRGMLLKSDGFASTLYDPEAEFTLQNYCEQHNIKYADLGTPVRVEDFCAYGLAFQRRFAPNLDNKRVLNRVRFRRQGKLEHRGATAVQPLARVARTHAKDARIASALAALKRSHPFADADVAALAGEVAIEAV
jgi:flavin-dependent dehydrogenase